MENQFLDDSSLEFEASHNIGGFITYFCILKIHNNQRFKPLDVALRKVPFSI